MKLLLILLTIYSSIAFAEELKISYLSRQFILNHTSGEIVFQGKNVDLSLKRRKCSETIFNNFDLAIKDIEQTARSLDQESVIYTWKGKTYEVSPKSKFGYFLVTLPEEMKRMKTEEMIRCSN